MKTLKRIINWTVWSLLALYLLLMAATRLPFCQHFIGNQIASAIGDRIGTYVSVGRVDLGLLNRVIIDDVSILDQQNKRMLTVSRLSASVDLLPLAEGKIRISSAQLFGAHAYLYQRDSLSKPNFQFVLDSLASKDTTSHKPLDLRVNTYIIRHSSVAFDRQDMPTTPGVFNPRHINVSDISAHILLKALTDDSLNLQVKRLGFQERSGLTVSKLALRLNADKQQAQLREFLMEMPSSRLQIDSLDASYRFDEKGLVQSSLVFGGAIDNSFITPSDLRAFQNSLKNFQRSISLTTHFNGTYRHIDIPQLNLASEAGDIHIVANGFVDGWQDPTPAWRLDLNQLLLSDAIIDFLHKNIDAIPDELIRIGSLKVNGQFSGEHNGAMAVKGNIFTGIGDAVVNLHKQGNNHFEGTVTTTGLDLQQLTADDHFGRIIADLSLSGLLRSGGTPDVKVNGVVSQFDYNGYSFSNIDLNGTYSPQGYSGLLQIDDPNIQASVEGELMTAPKGQQQRINLTGAIHHFVPEALHLSNQWGNAVFAGNIEADITARSLKDAIGTLRISNFSMTDDNQQLYHLDNLLLTSTMEQGRRNLSLISDFAKADLQGDFDLATLPQSFINMIGSKLPTLPGLPKLTDNAHNNFIVRLQVYKSDWLQRLLDMDLGIQQPAILNMRVNDNNRTLNLDGYLPAFTHDGSAYSNGEIHLSSPADTLLCNVNVTQGTGSDRLFLALQAKAIDNNLDTRLSWHDGKKTNSMSGELNSITTLYRNLAQKPEAHVRVQPSHIVLNDTVWNVEPSDILYSENNLLVDHFNVHHQQQHITIDGRASKNNHHDSLTVDLNEVEVAYILDLVKFDAVEFSGRATGKAIVKSLFDEPDAHATLDVHNFKFERGRMGTLHALVFWNNSKQQIDINAQANDGPGIYTDIYGFVSPTHNTIALNIDAHQTYVDFMHNFTNSFLSSITGHADGSLLLAGTLDEMNLTGELAVEGEATVTALNTTYQMHRDTIIFIPDEIELRGLPLTDRYGHHATLSGGIHHKHLTQLTFDLFVNADNLLAYDFKDFGDSNFYGTVFATGDVSIKGRPGEVTIDINVTPQENTLFVYNASSPDAISSQEFIQWGSGTTLTNSQLSTLNSQLSNEDEEPDIPTDIYINFLVNCTPAATLRLLMDANTNDYINLNGNGTIRATFYNKGPFNMFGTYTVDHGTYGVTIQNIIKKNFTFNPGGTIVFGGDPYQAALNLQAQHIVSGVSLSDLSIGNSFASNTIRVNCLMNITGRPEQPQVDFDLEMPTVNADEQQMIRSVINGQQEMNQQVLYLLAIGRFYNRGQNNATTTQQQDQTSLAMQSLLSGTLSAQINTLLNTVIKNDNWNFGANISTGNEGWHNAEYEGLFSGRMLNNRLLLNGQFGYRDNATRATKSFIGDFDIQYLLLPNGNLSVKMYNMTNDRYFTKSSLNTQGLGIIMKKDFNGLRDLFSSEKKKKNLSPEPGPSDR